MEKITPHLWFDKEAREAAELHTSVFENSRIKNTTVLDDTPSGSVDVVTIELAGQEKVARVTEAFLKMRKFDIATLEKAAEGV